MPCDVTVNISVREIPRGSVKWLFKWFLLKASSLPFPYASQPTTTFRFSIFIHVWSFVLKPILLKESSPQILSCYLIHPKLGPTSIVANKAHLHGVPAFSLSSLLNDHPLYSFWFYNIQKFILQASVYLLYYLPTWNIFFHCSFSPHKESWTLYVCKRRNCSVVLHRSLGIPLPQWLLFSTETISLKYP